MPTDPYKYFRIEARQLVEQLGHGALELEKGPPPREVAPKLLRLAHTLKGAARVVKQGEIANLAHAIEDALAPLRERAEPASRDQVDALLALIDAIRSLLPGLDVNGAALVPVPVEDPIQRLPAEPGEMDSLAAGLAEAMAQLQSLRRWSELAEHAKRSAEALTQQLSLLRVSETGRAGPGVLAEDLRIEVGRLEGSLSRGLDLVQRELRQVVDTTERLRLLPASAVFSTLERVAHDAARVVHKQIDFVTEGGEIRLDGGVLLQVQKALVQIVRNAIAHGIEDPTVRAKAGKPLAGRVQLRVLRRGNQVSFLCRDDGQGIDLAAVRRAASAKGRLAPNAQPEPEELFQLLLTGGLSTSGTITQVSGRGVGLDVVREVMEGLGGRVRLHSSPGQGAELELLAPVSLASLEALMLEAAGQIVALPLDSVEKAFRISPADVSTGDGGDIVVHEGRALPLISLAQALQADARSEIATCAVVVNGRASTVALGVNRILGSANVVLRPLPALVPADVIALGACLDAEGNAQLVLDEDRVAVAPRRSLAPAAPLARRLPVLIVDDSLTTRMLEQSILESAGYEVALATSAEEGLEMARQRRHGLFLVDVEMPGMDGFQFVQSTRDDAALRDTPAILVTSRHAAEDRARGQAVGAIAYVVKSEFDQSKLLEIVRRVVG